VRVVRCRLSKTDHRRERRKQELIEVEEELKRSHEIAAAIAQSEGKYYEIPKDNKKKKAKKLKPGEKPPPTEEIDYQ
jgi:hypothetical protein